MLAATERASVSVSCAATPDSMPLWIVRTVSAVPVSWDAMMFSEAFSPSIRARSVELP